MGDFLRAAKRRRAAVLSRGQGPLLTSNKTTDRRLALLRERAQVARAVWTRSVPDPGRDSLEKRSPLATGHPLTRIRVFNSASEEECDREREKERERKKEGESGMRMEAIGLLARTALQPIGWIVTISSPTGTKIYTSILTIASRVITLIRKFHGVSSKVLRNTQLRKKQRHENEGNALWKRFCNFRRRSLKFTRRAGGYFQKCYVIKSWFPHRVSLYISSSNDSLIIERQICLVSSPSHKVHRKRCTTGCALSFTGWKTSRCLFSSFYRAAAFAIDFRFILGGSRSLCWRQNIERTR